MNTIKTKFNTEYALMERLLEMIGQLGIVHKDKDLFALFDSMVQYINDKLSLPCKGPIVEMYFIVEQCV